MSGLTSPSVDIHRIAESVFQESHLAARLLSVSADPADATRWRVMVLKSNPDTRMRIILTCGPGTSAVDVRRSFKQQLGIA